MKRLNRFHHLKYLLTSLTYGTILVALIVLPFAFKIEDKSFIIPATVGLLAFYIGWLQYSLQRDNFFKDLFKDFTIRYDRDFANFFIEIQQVESSGYKIKPEDKQLIIKYISFCAEEYLWFKKGRIDKTTWINWRSGIIQNVRHDAVIDIVKVEKKESSSSYYGLFDDLDID